MGPFKAKLTSPSIACFPIKDNDLLHKIITLLIEIIWKRPTLYSKEIVVTYIDFFRGRKKQFDVWNLYICQSSQVLPCRCHGISVQRQHAVGLRVCVICLSLTDLYPEGWWGQSICSYVVKHLLQLQLLSMLSALYWAISQYKTIFPGMRIPMLKIRRSWGRLIFQMGIPILVRRYLFIEAALSNLVCRRTDPVHSQLATYFLWPKLLAVWWISFRQPWYM